MASNSPEICREGESPMTKQKLQKLKEEIRNFKIPEDPNNYNVPETKLENTDNVSGILKKIFANENVPRSVIERIELALSANHLDLEKLKKDNGVSAWKVEKGYLIFISSSGEKKSDVFTISILPWSVLQAPEKNKEETHRYDLGVYSGSPVLKGEPDNIEGSVDLTLHSATLKTRTWYAEKTLAAKTLLDWYAAKPGAFDPATVNMIKKYYPLLLDLSSQTVFDPAFFHEQFEKKHGKDEVFGGEGVYNFVLAFQRVLDKISHSKTYPLDMIRERDIVISLRIGKKINNGNERYVKTSISDKPKDQPPVICPPQEPPEEQPPDPEEIETGIGKLFSSTAVLKAGILGREQQMTAPTIDKGGKTYKTFFILPGGNRINPARYIAYCRNDRYTVYVGEMDYNSGVVSTTATPGKILKVITLDSSSPAATRRSILDIPNQL